MGLGDLNPNDDDSDKNKTSRRYVDISQEDFEGFLHSLPWSFIRADTGSDVKEVVYETNEYFPDNHLIVLRIWSTIDERSGQNRSKGSDAIRTTVYRYPPDETRDEGLGKTGAVIGGRTKTLRIETWRKNLREKIEDMMAEQEEYVRQCGECSGFLEKREGQYGEFYGCTNYPDCEYTENID